MAAADKSLRTTDTLLDIGFIDVAQWFQGQGENTIEYRLDGPNAHANVLLLDEVKSLYAFVREDSVLYIGKTSRTVRRRFVTYRKPGLRQATNLRCNRKIRECISRGEVVRILVFNPISFLRYGDFDINLAAGLEDSLIYEFDPPWNGREDGRPITEEAEREEADESEVRIPSERQQLSSAPFGKIGSQGQLGEVAAFQLILGDTYYQQGLINAGVAASRYLGQHGEPIQISFSDGTEPVISRINRTANRSGGVRVVGRNTEIARWFHANFTRGETVNARVLDKNRIELLRK